MLDQIIYTRCSPHRDLKNGGASVRGDGFGVFAVSPRLFANKQLSSYDYLQGRLAVQNGAKETSPIGLFNSYEYSILAPGVTALSFEVARPHCKTPRANGKAHRSGTYIKQCLVGKPEGYPVDWFGASVWTAHLEDENSYYLDEGNQTSDPLPQVPNKPGKGRLTPAVVREFVSQGRAEAVKAGIWYLLREYERPENDRKVLLIKDTPENVELWIAAMEYAFPVSMAQTITFTTNRSRLGEQADSALYYYTDAAGQFYPRMDRSINQIRHPYCMIVGYHPNDSFCAALKPMPMSNFVVIDGTTKTVSFQTDGSVHDAYYDAAIRYDEDIQDFCNVVLPSLAIRDLSTKLPELFDAYRYLLDSDHGADKWNYAETVRNLNALLQYGMPQNGALNGYLVGACLKAYQRFVPEDEAKGYGLLKIMWELAKVTGKEREITGCLADSLGDKLNDLAGGRNSIVNSWSSMKKENVVMVIQPALCDLFNDTELTGYATQFKNCSPAVIETVMDMFFRMLAVENQSMAVLKNSTEKYGFFCTGLVYAMDDPGCLNRIAARLRSVPDLLDSVTLSVAQYIEKVMPHKLVQWWDAVIAMNGGSVSQLCRSLCASHSADIDMIEQLLTNRLERSRKFDADMCRSFRDAVASLEKKPDTGRRLFGAWIRLAAPGEYLSVIQTIRSFSLAEPVQTELFRALDARLPYDGSNGVSSVAYQEMRQWSKALNIVSRSVSFYDFKGALEKERKAERAVDRALWFAEQDFTVDKEFLSGDYYASIVSVAAEHHDDLLHIAMLCLFRDVEGISLECFVDQYAAKVLSFTKKPQLVAQLMSLCEATMGNQGKGPKKYDVQCRNAAFVQDVQAALDAALKKQLVACYKPSLAESIKKSKEWDKTPEVRDRLLALLEEAGKKTPQKGIGGFFGSLFGKK